MASDYEGGEDVTEQLTRSKNPGMVVSVRFNATEVDKLLALAENTGRTVSRVIKDAVLGQDAGQYPIQMTSQEAFWVKVEAGASVLLRNPERTTR